MGREVDAMTCQTCRHWDRINSSLGACTLHGDQRKRTRPVQICSRYNAVARPPRTLQPIQHWQTLPKRIRKRREDLRMTAEALARAAGVHRNTVGRVERGEECTVETLALILSALGASLRVSFARDQEVDR